MFSKIIVIIINYFLDDFDILEPMNMLVVAWYWMVLATMTNGIGDILANSGTMMLYISIFIVLGKKTWFILRLNFYNFYKKNY